MHEQKAVSESLPEGFALQIVAESAACGDEIVELKASAMKSFLEISV